MDTTFFLMRLSSYFLYFPIPKSCQDFNQSTLDNYELHSQQFICNQCGLTKKLLICFGSISINYYYQIKVMNLDFWLFFVLFLFFLFLRGTSAVSLLIINGIRSVQENPSNFHASSQPVHAPFINDLNVFCPTVMNQVIILDVQHPKTRETHNAKCPLLKRLVTKPVL